MSLGLAVLITGNLTSAFWVSSPWKWCSTNANFPNCSSNQYMYNTPALQNTNYDDYNAMAVNTVNKFANYEKTNGSGLFYTYNNGDYFYTYYSTNTYVKFSYNFINYGSNGGDGRNFYWRNDTKKKYNSFSSPNLGFGVDSLPGQYFTYYQPWDATWIFYNQDYASGLHTVQFIGDYQLVDRFLYVDVRATVDNVWLVDTANSVAWSTTVDDPYMISQILFGKVALNDQFFNEFGWDTWYDVNMGGSSFLPLTVGNKVCNGLSSGKPGVSVDSLLNSFACRTSIYSNIGLTYQQRYTEVVQPSYGNSNNGSGSVSSGSYDSQIRSYEQCIADNTPIKELSHLGFKCLEVVNNNPNITDEDFLELFMYIERLDYYIGQNVEYTGYYPNTAISNWCGRWVNYAESIYPNYTTGNYHDLALIAGTYVDTDSYDLEYACGSYPSVSSEQSWACTYLGVGCDGFSFGMGYDQVKSFVKPFWDESIGQLVNSFNSGYNYINIPSCSNDYYGKSYGRANTIFIVLVAFLIFQFYQLFKS